MSDNMAANLERTKGMILSEGLTFKLASKMGKQSAHAVLKQVVAAAHEGNVSLREAAEANEQLSRVLQEDPELLDVRSHLGRAPLIADAAVNLARSNRKCDATVS